MARTVETTVYHFDELSDRAKDKARDWYRNQSSDPDIFESCLEDIKIAFGALGVAPTLRTVKLHGSGTRQDLTIYYSIGNRDEYVAFAGSYGYAKHARKAILDHFGGDDGDTLAAIADGLKDVQRRYFYRLSSHISDHRGVMRVSTEYDGMDYRQVTPEDCATVSELITDIEHWALKLMTREYEYQNSNEAVDENIIANEYEFTEDGERA